MIYLADACAVIVFFASHQPDDAMPTAAHIMRSGQVGVLAVTVWEISQKIAAGKLPPLPAKWSSVADLLHDHQFHQQPFTWNDAHAAAELPSLHKDPIDRMLISVALQSNIPVITSDRIFRDYGVTTLW